MIISAKFGQIQRVEVKNKCTMNVFILGDYLGIYLKSLGYLVWMLDNEMHADMFLDDKIHITRHLLKREHPNIQHRTWHLFY